MNITDLDLSILKGIVSNKKNAIDFVNTCDTKVFSTDVWNFANIIVSYVKIYKDLPTLRVIEDQLAKGNNKALIEHTKTLWKKIEDHKADDKEFSFDLQKLKNKYAEKQLVQYRDALVNTPVDKLDIDKSLQEMQRITQNIKSVKTKKAYERKTLREAIPEFKEEFDAKLKDPTIDSGIMTGYSYLDSATDGLRGGELVLVGGESGGGKSMLLMNMAVQIWMGKNTTDMRDNFTKGCNVMYFSLEMPYKPCRNRLLSRLSGAPSKLIRSAKLNGEDAKKLTEACRFVKAYPKEFEIIDIPRGVTMETIEMLYEDAKMHYEPDVIVIDYLGLMEYEDSNLDDWLKLGKIAEKIHEFARVHNKIVLSAVQLNRAKAGKDVEEKIGLHRIGRSALIMQNANIAVQIETRQNEKQFPDMFYHLIKNRDGELGKGKLIKNLACGTLLDDEIKDEDVGYEFTDVDDISDKIEFLDI